MRVTLDGQPLLAGRHMLSDGAVFASAIPTKRIGPAYKERVHIVLRGVTADAPTNPNPNPSVHIVLRGATAEP